MGSGGDTIQIAGRSRLYLAAALAAADCWATRTFHNLTTNNLPPNNLTTPSGVSIMSAVRRTAEDQDQPNNLFFFRGPKKTGRTNPMNYSAKPISGRRQLVTKPGGVAIAILGAMLLCASSSRAETDP